MRRSPRSTILWIVAALVAVATALAVASDLAAIHRQARDLGPARDVLVARRDLPVGSRIGPDDVTVARRHRSQVPTDALASLDRAPTRTVAVTVIAGAVLQPGHLAPGPGRGPASLVRPGHRIVRVRGDAFVPEPGTVVDVLVSVDPGLAGTIDADPTAVAAAGAVVVGGDEDPDGSLGDGVLLLVRERDAERLAFAGANGVLTLAVAPPEDACCRTSSWGSSRG